MTGSGTQADLYLIYDVDDLQAIEDDLTAYYELANDIDASETSTWNAGAGFDPIKFGYDFTGNFDGKGHIITGLYISRLLTGVGGLFYTNDGVIRDVGLVDCDIAGIQSGGIVYVNTGTLSDCYTTGAVAGGGFAGGVVQWNNGGTIQDCYSRCSITGSRTGGFVQWNDGTIENCYSTGAVTTTLWAGGFCQYNSGTIENSFWDIETSGQATSEGATGKTTAEMKTLSTFTDAGWDFTIIWDISPTVNDGYPVLGQLVTLPEVTTDPASALSAIDATPNGTLDDDGGEDCDCGFEWGLDTGYGITTPTETKTVSEIFSQVIGGLFPNTVYHFRAFAANSFGTGHGADRTFTTALIISRAYALARREL